MVVGPLFQLINQRRGHHGFIEDQIRDAVAVEIKSGVCRWRRQHIHAAHFHICHVPVVRIADESDAIIQLPFREQERAVVHDFSGPQPRHFAGLRSLHSRAMHRHERVKRAQVYEERRRIVQLNGKSAVVRRGDSHGVFRRTRGIVLRFAKRLRAPHVIELVFVFRLRLAKRAQP